ncbi:hypothetical protein BDN71DRAFT_1050159 [Pleurotus eryngii]|uniref:Uncharacterized protein n=1 Tax=Pleurotus eryngii TaxID=5323 RepID=A0A9P5ZVB8_PLEER|nr:hypothetical protein BDN71DRAFT_1050159 [Pleurotus eryngii]
MAMSGARKGEEGVVGDLMYTVHQVGATLSFTEGLNAPPPADSPSLFVGYAASFWSMVAMPGVMFVIALLLVKR